MYKLYKVVKAHELHGETAKYLLAALVAGLVAYAVVRWFMGYMKEHNTGIFIAYRILFGLTILVLFHSDKLIEHKTEEVKTSAPATHATRLMPHDSSGKVAYAPIHLVPPHRVALP